MNNVPLGCDGPIGVFDSGIGGLSVAHAIQQRLPHESIVYIADSRHAPYGEKTDDYIYQRMALISQWLLSQGVKVIVVACNTATTAAISRLRAQFPIPIIGVEPGVKPAVLASKTGVVGVLATPRTLQTPAFSTLASRFAAQARVELQACPELVRKIEALDFDSEQMRALLHSYIAPLLTKGADTLVLGCTHYNFVAPTIASVAGKNITIIRTEAAVAQEVERRLQQIGLLAPSQHIGRHRFYTSGDLALFSQQLAVVWQADNDASHDTATGWQTGFFPF